MLVGGLLEEHGSVYSATSGKRVGTSATPGNVRALASGLEGRVLAGASAGSEVWLRELDPGRRLEGGRERARLDLHALHDVPMAIALSPDGRMLAVGTGRSLVLVYTVAER